MLGLFIKWFFFYLWLPIILSAFLLTLKQDSRWGFTIWLPLLIFSGFGFVTTGIFSLPFYSVLGPLSFLCPFPYLGVLISCLRCKPSRHDYPWLAISLVILICSVLVAFANRYRINQPIHVVTADGKPLAGMAIEFRNNDPLLSRSGTRITDANGMATITGYAVERLSAAVVTDDYHVPASERRLSFGFEEDAKQKTLPVLVFHLQKKEKAVSLIAIDRNFQLSTDGESLEIHLKTGTAAPSERGDLIVEFSRSGTNQHFAGSFTWNFKVAIPEGGLTLSTNKSVFTAPESGYEPLHQINMRSVGPSKFPVSLEYFCKLPDSNYARIFFDLFPYDGSLRIRSFINPFGSRNLELDPVVQPKQTVFE